ncbi:MAG: glycoside hydrolase family 2 TIM barrel-domain containing protein [Lachnospiraceae bacterium]
MQPQLAWLEDPEVFQVNRLDAHSDHMYYQSEEDRQSGKNRLCQSLNGQWKFAWSSRPADRPERFYEEGYEDSAFGTITVPGHIELQGYDQIHYINTMYPWDGKAFLRPPHIDWDYNPVGSYVKEFDLEQPLLGKRICISFQGVEQAFFVWLNGQFIGYSEDTFTPSEFDLTDVIKERNNRLCVEVYKRSSAAWLEDQDFFRFSGIFREVYLFAKPECHVEDLWVQAGVKEDYKTGTFSLKARLSGQGYTLFWSLKDKEKNTVLAGRKDGQDVSEGSYLEIAQEEIPDAVLWNCENPYLYQLELTVCNSEGEIVEIVPYKTGFRRFEIKDKIMLLNGKRLIINGVNRHEWNPRRGRSITEEDMRKDMAVLKKNNINAVRTCHYPNQSLWYHLCDENGIYVMDETNLESHGSWQKMGACEPSWNVPGSLSEWKECVVDRAKSMLERDKNHTSILWWSCGNESYAGECIRAMSQYFRQTDPSRLVHYEGVFWNREFDDISDVESRMYAPPKEVREYLENDPQKPYLLCEYMHDMGNSIGGMESYIRLLDEYPMYQGGFIWDFKDQAVYKKDVDGTDVLGYGGDFNDRPTDYAFSGNGIVFADGSEKPAMQEVRYWYSRKEEREVQDASNAEKDARARREAAEFVQNLTDGGTNSDNTLTVVHGDVNLGVKGTDFHIIFSYTEHGIVSLVYGQTEWVYRPALPAFWRGTTENDKGNGFPKKSAVWLGADQFIQCTGWKTEEQENQVSITYEYQTCTSPAAKVEVAYTVYPTGAVRVHTHYFGQKGLPELPLFGLRFSVPFLAERVEWQGLSGETYPDRKKGGVFGIWESPLEKPDYLVPQEYGCHMETVWMKLKADDGSNALRITMSGRQPFHFSAVPYTPEELENALHKEELPAPRRTIVSILAAMRGVGGIDSWGSDVEEAYHVSAEEDMDYEFIISR